MSDRYALRMLTGTVTKDEVKAQVEGVIPPWLRQMAFGELTRQCGWCSACCVAHDVDEVDKPGGMECQHQTCGGCAIHASKPFVCAEYRCAWLAGLVDGDRPSVSGLLAALANEGWVVYEMRPGALATAEAWRLVCRLVSLTGLGVKVITFRLMDLGVNAGLGIDRTQLSRCSQGQFVEMMEDRAERIDELCAMHQPEWGPLREFVMRMCIGEAKMHERFLAASPAEQAEMMRWAAEFTRKNLPAVI